MATNPLVDQGTLNRLRANLIVTNFPSLNVTASYLGKEGISLTLEGEATLMIPTMTGAVTSPEPYQLCSVQVHLLKTQNIANLYKLQMEDSTLLGPITLVPDAVSLGKYPLVNCAIQSVAPISFNGQVAEWVLTLQGYYNINNSLWNLI